MTTINLTKGQTINLTKGFDSLNNVMIGLGWDEVNPKKYRGNDEGFMDKLANLFRGVSSSNEVHDIDCDASVLLLDHNGKLKDFENLVYYGKQKSNCGSVVHSGDNLTGGGNGDCEQIKVNLKFVPRQYERVLFVVNIYKCFERNQHFGFIDNAYIRVVDNDTKKELARYNLSEGYDGNTAIIVGELVRQGEDWGFHAIGEASRVPGLSELIKQY